ncbi:MAG: rod shape-determining protein RodA [Chloroflexi bacterium]|nr:rod shape-determining protein RodA [Chloroflexota bacterium]
MREGQAWRNFDGVLVCAVAALVAYGAAMLYSASYAGEVAFFWTMDSPVTRHLLYALVGLGLLVLVARLDYHVYSYWSPAIYLALLLLLGAVLVAGESIYGARRWLDSPLIPIQPSELAKTGVIIVLAQYFAARQANIKSPRTTLGSLVLAGLPLALVFLQPDLGSAMIFAAIWGGMALAAGTPLLHFAVLGSLAVATLPLAFTHLLKDYQRDRLLLFLNPAQDPLGDGYNIIQSEISIGSGGLLGKGFLNGTQTQLHYLRIQKTDFIFSVIGEELGFVGALLLFILFAVLIFRVLRSSSVAPDSLGRLIASGVAVALLFQVFINIGVNIRLLPVTGIPLPFISAGGSSLMSTMLALGVVQSVAMRRKPRHRFESA